MQAIAKSKQQVDVKCGTQLQQAASQHEQLPCKCSSMWLLLNQLKLASPAAGLGVVHLS
jgi:hypothetical protein